MRSELERPAKMLLSDLQDLSFYAFWRLYYVNGKRIVQRRKEKIVAINGAGWPRQAKRSHEKHDDYAKKTLYAYMPCAQCCGTSYIDAVVCKYFRGNCLAVLEAFVHDPINKWCPSLIRRNYDVQNSDEAHDQDVLAVPAKYARFVFEEDLPDPNADVPTDNPHIPEDTFVDTHPHVPTKKPLYVKLQHLPLDAGEPNQADTNDDPDMTHDLDHWKSEDRPKWQLHSALGPNINPEALAYRKEALQEHVNPLDYDYSQAAVGIDVEDLATRWQDMQEDFPLYTDETLKKEDLDEFQLLFVTLVLKHIEEVLEALDKDLEPEPLRLMLIGTAGTGKSTATKTLLQELRRRLRGHNLEVDFFKVAAPTGAAAFNVRFNATTIHRLIHWFT